MGQERLAPIRSRLHPVPVVFSLFSLFVAWPVIRGQKQVIPLARLHPVFGVGDDFRERPGAHRGAVTFRPGIKAVHGDDEHMLAAQMVIDVVVFAEEKAIHVGQPVRVAGTQAEQDLVLLLQRGRRRRADGSTGLLAAFPAEQLLAFAEDEPLGRDAQVGVFVRLHKPGFFPGAARPDAHLHVVRASAWDEYRIPRRPARQYFGEIRCLELEHEGS